MKKKNEASLTSISQVYGPLLPIIYPDPLSVVVNDATWSPYTDFNTTSTISRRPIGSGPVLGVVPYLPISPKSVAVGRCFELIAIAYPVFIETV